MMCKIFYEQHLPVLLLIALVSISGCTEHGPIEKTDVVGKYETSMRITNCFVELYPDGTYTESYIRCTRERFNSSLEEPDGIFVYGSDSDSEQFVYVKIKFENLTNSGKWEYKSINGKAFLILTDFMFDEIPGLTKKMKGDWTVQVKKTLAGKLRLDAIPELNYYYVKKCL